MSDKPIHCKECPQLSTCAVLYGIKETDYACDWYFVYKLKKLPLTGK